MTSMGMLFIACCVTGSVAIASPRLDRRAMLTAFLGSLFSMLAFAGVSTHLAYAQHPALAATSWLKIFVFQVFYNGTGMLMFASAALVIPVVVRRLRNPDVA